MTYSFDSFGWYSAAPIAGRTTAIEPPAHGEKTVGQPYPNFTGIDWVLVAYSEPVVATPEPIVNPTEWLIDIGPFYDRLGAAKMAVLTSADSGVKAVMADVQIRKWIDLKRADVASSLAYIGSKVPALDAPLQAAIINTPVAPEENLALRKLYFS